MAIFTFTKNISRSVFVIFNLVGLVVYLRFASLIWAPPGDEGLYGGPGDPIIWVVFALPSLAICSFVNILVFRTVCARAIIYGQWVPLLGLAVIIALWIVAFEYDSSRQYNGGLLRTEQPFRTRH